MRKQVIMNTYNEMIKRHPDQKKIIDIILKVKIESLTKKTSLQDSGDVK